MANDNRREIYQRDMELELLTERRMPNWQWVAQAWEAARAYAKQRPSDPNAYDIAMARMQLETFSIAEVRRAAKEGWVL